MSLELIAIAAVSLNGVIGSNNDLPWYIPEDLDRFKNLTIGFPLIMGRNTYESIYNKLQKPLPKRKSLVLTTKAADLSLDPKYDFKRVSLYASISDLKDELENHEKVFLIGGAQVYSSMIPLCNALEITEVHQDVKGDTYFPKIEKNIWEEVKREDKQGFSFVRYERR